MSRELFEHYLRDEARLGPSLDGGFTGAAGGAACGDLSRVSLLIEDGRVACVSFDAEGCGATRAATAAVAEMVDGEPVIEVARIGIDEVDEAIGGLTPAKRHAAQLAADALHRALAGAAASSKTLAAPRRGRVLIAMSGGVDSAVAALLERERGAEVLAVTLKLWADPETDGAKACCSPEAVLGARAVAHSLGIPHLTLDLEEEFRRRVVGAFLDGYGAGATPNPCIVCNGEVRIAAMVDLAERLGADYLVTGHYARIVEDGDGPLLAAASDRNKDQSYMLAALPPAMLDRLRFPLTELSKPEVREIAARHGLSVAKKPESQDLCFLAGQGKGAVPASPRRPRRARGCGPRPLRPGDRPPSWPPQLHRRAAARDRRIRAGAPLCAGNRCRREHGHRRPPRGAGGEDGAGPRRRPAPRRRPGRRGQAALPGDAGPGLRLGGGERPSRRADVELGEAFDAAAPGQAAVLLCGEAIVGHGTIAAAA